MNEAGDILFLAANTSRSKAYAQAMEQAELGVSRTLILDKPLAEEGAEFPDVTNFQHEAEVFLPDLNIPLAETAGRICDQVDAIAYTGIKESGIKEYLLRLEPKLLVYSGYGGELVPGELLSLGIPFLHIHSGWLPQFRGSTTVYYSLLTEYRCGVSAILLEPQIDNGPIVARQHYAPPPPGLDVDHLYDNAIRADLLVQVLRDWQAKSVINPLHQNEVDSQTYYVIHPVLKHLTLLSLEKGIIQAKYHEDSGVV
tara:strand:- start:511 stop:1275 length:765 start_codon:yes stop_codon:yes gene_type:complete